MINQFKCLLKNNYFRKKTLRSSNVNYVTPNTNGRQCK